MALPTKDLAVYSAAGCTLIAGALHLSLAINLASANWLINLFFAVAAIAQIFWVLPIVKKWSNSWKYVGIFGTVALIFIWVNTRFNNNAVTGVSLPIDNVGIIVLCFEIAFVVLCSIIIASNPKAAVPPPAKVVAGAYSGKWGHVLWIGVTVSLIVALFLAYATSIRPDLLNIHSLPAQLPSKNVTITSNSTTVTSVIETNQVPIIPLFVLNWGYICAAVYVLKVVTQKLSNKKFSDEEIPIHIARLFIGPAFAIIVYFIIISGGLFGLTIDLTKISPQYIQYVYASLAFLTAYFVRRVVDKLSKILDSIFGTT